MKLYLVRHAEAVEEKIDGHRSLSPTGQADARKLAGCLARLSVAVEAVWHSPKARAKQTAAALRGAVRSSRGFVARGGLLPLDPVKPLASEINKHGGDLMIVGHEPFLGALAAKLLVGKSSAEVLELAKGAVACMEKSGDKTWRLLWMIRPELLPDV